MAVTSDSEASASPASRTIAITKRKRAGRAMASQSANGKIGDITPSRRFRSGCGCDLAQAMHLSVSQASEIFLSAGSSGGI